MKFSDFLKKYWVPIVIGLLIIIKLLVTINIPLNVRDSLGADEYLMLYNAEYLIKGEWLGPYNYLTLVKGAGFPLFLCLAFKLGLSYLALYSLFYSFACLVALAPIKKLVNNKYLELLFFTLLLFCPISFDNHVQLVYRNMLILPQSIILVASLMMMYLNLKESKFKLFSWSLLASFMWIFMWHTREDTIWSIPLVFGAYLVIVLTIIFNKNITAIINKIIKIGIITVPIVLLFLSIQVVSFINYKYYGIYTTNQLNDSNYTKAVMEIMKIKPDKEIENVVITRDSLRKAYAVSPTFKKLEPIIEADYDGKAGLYMAYGDNGEINEDLITWELIGSASVAGYYENSSKAEKFWGKVYDEISKAINDGKLETRKTLPTRSLAPFPSKAGSLKHYIHSIYEVYVSSIKYSNSHIEFFKTDFEENLVRRYESISGARAIRQDKAIVYLEGYVFAKDNKKTVKVYLQDENKNIIKEIDLKESEYIYGQYHSQGKDYKNAKNCFIHGDYELPVGYSGNVYLVAKINNKEVAKYNIMNLDEFFVDKSVEMVVAYDNSGIRYDADPMLARSWRYVRIVQRIRNVYSNTGIPIFIISLSYYILLTINMIVSLFKKKVYGFEKWLLLSACFGSVFVILAGLGYVNAFMFKATAYLSSCNALLCFFEFGAIAFLINDLKTIISKIIKNKK